MGWNRTDVHTGVRFLLYGAINMVNVDPLTVMNATYIGEWDLYKHIRFGQNCLFFYISMFWILSMQLRYDSLVIASPVAYDECAFIQAYVACIPICTGVSLYAIHMPLFSLHESQWPGRTCSLWLLTSLGKSAWPYRVTTQYSYYIHSVMRL